MCDVQVLEVLNTELTTLVTLGVAFFVGLKAIVRPLEDKVDALKSEVVRGMEEVKGELRIGFAIVIMVYLVSALSSK